MVRMSKKRFQEVAVPPPHNWRTTDEDEINRRRARAHTEQFRIANTDPRHPIFSNFCVHSSSGLSYAVEIREVRERQFSCECVDFRINGLGTCKHVEAVLLHLRARFKRLFEAATKNHTPRLDVVPDPASDSLRLVKNGGVLPRPLRTWFDTEGRLCRGAVEEAIEALRQLGALEVPELRLSQELWPWVEARSRAQERKRLRHEYELKVQSGEWPMHETKVPLFPYQREGMLHLAFTERALLADEMGLGKTIQAIAACALLHRLGQAQHVLVVTPASLKTEWEEQIQRFTELDYQLVFGGRSRRLKAYDAAGQFSDFGVDSSVPERQEVAPWQGGHQDNPQSAGGPSRWRSPLPPLLTPKEWGEERGRGMGRQGPALPFFTVVNYEQMLAPARHCSAGRGAADQELEHEDDPGNQEAAEPLRVRADRHADRKPH